MTDTSLAEHLEFTTLCNEDREQWRSMCNDYGQGGDYTWDDSKADIVWSWLNDPAHSLECLVAKCNTGQLVGYINYIETPHPGHACNYGYIADLYTHPDYRRKGIATRLIEQVSKIGRQRGWRSLRWLSYGDNEEAKKLYDRIAERKDRIVYQLTI